MVNSVAIGWLQKANVFSTYQLNSKLRCCNLQGATKQTTTPQNLLESRICEALSCVEIMHSLLCIVFLLLNPDQFASAAMARRTSIRISILDRKRARSMLLIFLVERCSFRNLIIQGHPTSARFDPAQGIISHGL